MHKLAVADSVDVLVLVDNTTDFLSSAPPSVESELSRFWRRGARFQAGKLLCCAAHGLSCAITARVGATARTLLFDAGPDGAVLRSNVTRLGFDMSDVDALFLSHGHWDHAGGMLTALDLIRQAKPDAVVPTYMHPGMYRQRAVRSIDGQMRAFEDVPSVDLLQQHGAEVSHATEAMLVLDDLFFVSGEIPRLTPFEKGMPGQFRRTEDGGGWEPDPLLLDERFVAVQVKGQGLVIFTACSHAGLINVITCAGTAFPGVPIHGVLGGFHLAGATESVIPETIAALRPFRLPFIAPAHCTGWRAVGALATAFPEAVAPSAVGKTYHFQEARGDA